MIADSVAAVAQSEITTILLALLNVAQTVWLADIASRARRVRADDLDAKRARASRRRPPAQRRPPSEP